METTLEIPLFPYKVVLFPGMPLALHIFEERYKEMVSKCLDIKNEFGMLLVSGDQLCNVGCTAEITQILQRYNDGRLDLVIEGRRRFHVLEYLQRDLYLEAVIEYFDDDEEDVPDDLLTRVLKSYQDMIKLQTKGVGAVKGIFDPKQFSFIIASTMDIELEDKQTLLELTSTTERMRKLDDSLINIVTQLEELDKADRAASLNGRARHEDDE